MRLDMLAEAIASIVAAAGFLLALAVGTISLVRPARALQILTFVLIAASVAILSAGIAIRWADLGQPPAFGSFENSLAAAWILGVGTLLAARSATWRHLWLGTLPWASAVLFWGLRFNTNRIPLTISERSIWVDVHIVVSWLAFFAMTALLAISVLAVVRALEARLHRSWNPLSCLPSRTSADELVVQSSAYSFLGMTGVILTGAFYSWLLFGEVWRWDTVEVLALIAWVSLGLLLHMRLFFGWRGARLAILSVIAYAIALVMYWGLALFPVSSYHYFELPF